jgi:hypothetical protein
MKVASVILSLIILAGCRNVIMNLPAERGEYGYDYCTEFQSKVGELDNSIFKDYEKDKTFDLASIQNKVKPLLDEALESSTIWGENPGVPTKLVTLLHPTFCMREDIPSPYFEYVLTAFINSKRFKYGGIELQQETCRHLLALLSHSAYAEQYKCHHKLILNILFCYFNDKKYFNESSIGIIDRTVLKLEQGKFAPKLLPQYLLLLVISGDNHDYQLNRVLQKVADKCTSFNREDLIPWLALVLVAKDDKKEYFKKLAVAKREYLNKLVEIVKKTDNSQEGIMQATYMFPYLSMVQKPEIIELMKSFLNDDKIIDQGDDTIERCKGLSSLAAKVLYTMLEGYEKPSNKEFGQEERLKCIDWFKQNQDYRFRKIDYFGKDPIISKMGHVIFCVN